MIMTRFRNNLHQVRSNPKYFRAKNFKIFRSKKTTTKGPKLNSKKSTK